MNSTGLNVLLMSDYQLALLQLGSKNSDLLEHLVGLSIDLPWSSLLIGTEIND